MSKPSENNPNLEKQKSQDKTKPSSKKKYFLIGGLFVVCALFLKRDAH